MKKLYEMPEIEIVSFASEDAIMDADDLNGPSMGGDTEIWQ